MKEQPMLYIDTATELDYIEARLKDVPEKIASKRILKTALTAAARQARKQLIKDNKQRYALKKSGTFSRESKIIAAKTSKLEATVLPAALSTSFMNSHQGKTQPGSLHVPRFSRNRL